MTFRELIVLLPCQSLESLSLDRGTQEAEELLSGWSTLYHPALLVHSESMPRWASSEMPPEDPSGSLVIVPPSTESYLLYEWLDRAEGEAAKLVRHVHSREEMTSSALGAIAETPQIDPDLVGDFLSVGFCHFLVELLTRQLRYMSNLDEGRFHKHLQDAAHAAVEGNAEAAREQLREAFDRLIESREYFYPVETHMLDLTLAASTTIGESLRKDLSSGLINLMISGSVLDDMAQHEPATLAALKQAVEAGTTTLIGGDYAEAELPLLPLEDILDDFRQGLAAFQRHLGTRPRFYGRRRFGLTPLLPLILRRLGFDGVLHFTLDDGRFPSGNQSKIQWEGSGGEEIESLARVPLDARQADTFLRLPEKLGSSMDLDHASTAVFAHWPGQASPFYEDLQRMARYGAVLGRFESMAGYFESTQNTGQSLRYEADKYRSPYLRQDVAAERPDPISRWVRQHRRRAMIESIEALSTMSDLVTGRASASPAAGPDENLDAQLPPAAASFCQAVGAKAGEEGILLANTGSSPRQVYLDVSSFASLPDEAAPVVRAAESGGKKQVAVEVPAMGFAWVGPGSGQKKKAKKPEAPLVDENFLRNQYFQVRFNTTTGAIQSIQNYAMRGNRMALQLAMRTMDPSEAKRKSLEPGSEQEYSLMACDDIQTENQPLAGKVICRGRLMSREGELLARYVQTATARRGSRVLEIEVELEADQEPKSDPWGSYYAARFAWADETVDFTRSVGLAARSSEANFLEAPHFIDLNASRTRFTILTGGLPYHRRFGLRKLDTLLVVRGETARRFRLGIGIDLEHRARTALDFLADDQELSQKSAAPANRFGWLFHVDSKNVVATHWEPVVIDGKPVGFRVRLLETEGRYAKAGLQAFRDLASARKTDFLGQTLDELSIKKGRATLELRPHEWTEVEARF